MRANAPWLGPQGRRKHTQVSLSALCCWTVCAASGGENCGTSPSRAVKHDVSATAADFRPPFVDSERHLAAWPGPSSRTAGLS